MSPPRRRTRSPIGVYLEVGRDRKRAFAAAIDWPGWARSGRDGDAALAALVAYAPRYATALGTRSNFVAPADVSELDVVEELQGNATTDFGAPDAAPAVDEEPLRGAALARHRRILRACWKTFDAALRRAAGVELRKGPRGGGRDQARIAAHVLEAERSYLARLGVKYTDEAASGTAGDGTQSAEDTVQRMRPMRDAIIEALGRQPPDANGRKLWTPRFFVRRAAWHVLDHAWEIEDRAAPEP